MCMIICKYVFFCMYINVYVYMCMYTCIYIYVYICIYLYCVWAKVFKKCICMCVCIFLFPLPMCFVSHWGFLSFVCYHSLLLFFYFLSSFVLGLSPFSLTPLPP